MGNKVKTFVVLKHIKDSTKLLSDNAFDNTCDINVDNNFLDDTKNKSPSFKNGIELPTSTSDSDIANTYFHSDLPTFEISEKDTEKTVKISFGLVDSAKEVKLSFIEMCKTFTKHQLRKELRQLKNERNPSVSEIRFVSRMLRAKASSSTTNKVDSIDHDPELKYHFWNYVKYRSSHPEAFRQKGVRKICSKFTGEHPC